MKNKLNRRNFLSISGSGIIGSSLMSIPSNHDVALMETTSSNPQNSKDSFPVEIEVDAQSDLGKFKDAWSFFGMDEAANVLTHNGKKLLRDLNKLSKNPISLRAHHLFTTGNPDNVRLKWSPTNVYTEDEKGNPIYDWTTIDKLFDCYMEHNVRPFIELGFMPKALSSQPEPYEYYFLKNKQRDLGYTKPPKDYKKWGELIYQFTKHLTERYGAEETSTWLWEVWNEPDIFYWTGTLEEYLKLYDYAVAGVRKALPKAIIGGPTTTGPEQEKSATFLREFLRHCEQGKNYVTGEKGSPLDFISFHTKGRPKIVDGHVQMGIQRQLVRAKRTYEIIAEFPTLKKLPVIIGESDPEGTAAYNVEDKPENIFRQGPIYPVYNVVAYTRLMKLAESYGLDLQGNLTWAFMFENEPIFSGFRELSTHGINKAVVNGFKCLGMMTGNRLAVKSSGTVALEEMVATGVSNTPDVDAVAARNGNQLTVLVWHYHDKDIPAPVSSVNLKIHNLPEEAKTVLLEHFRVDEYHGNVYRKWLEMGTPKFLTSEQRTMLEKASEIPLMQSPEWLKTEKGELKINIEMPRYSLSLLKITW